MEFVKTCLPDDNKCFYYAAFNTQAIGHIVIDTDTKIVAANTWMFRIFNIPPSSISNSTFGSSFCCAAGVCCGQSPCVNIAGLITASTAYLSID
jgi:hypothetical protein